MFIKRTVVKRSSFYRRVTLDGDSVFLLRSSSVNIGYGSIPLLSAKSFFKKHEKQEHGVMVTHDPLEVGFYVRIVVFLRFSVQSFVGIKRCVRGAETT